MKEFILRRVHLHCDLRFSCSYLLVVRNLNTLDNPFSFFEGYLVSLGSTNETATFKVITPSFRPDDLFYTVDFDDDSFDDYIHVYECNFEDDKHE